MLALESVSVVHGSVVLRARVVRAERFAALLLLALVAFTFHVVSVLDRSVTVGAANGVAVLRAGFFITCAKRNQIG